MVAAWEAGAATVALVAAQVVPAAAAAELPSESHAVW